MSDDILKELEKKYANLGENPEPYLKGLLYSKPITYWDYIEVDTLLSLQKPRTDFKDEFVFIVYHQVTELVLRLMIHEVEQVISSEQPTEELLKDKLKRLIRYTDMLITSFDVMKEGMSHEDYNKFRLTLTPASGFQSAQFRFLEIYCTPILNLIHKEKHKALSEEPTAEEYLKHVYWRLAGYNPKTKSRSTTLKLFEDKYLGVFAEYINKAKGNTIYDKFHQIQSPSEDLIRLMKTFDNAYNVKWPMVHYNTAKHYLTKKGEAKTATGGSQWEKYLHPKFQKRTFFPKLWENDSILEFQEME
ncbi:MAG: tryptophan 2,3-dioxygenase [Bacteroidetes bacterium]|jgi:tryptophan 2,3-dioxygenase|nr:tryptophan 2,3-dioxygenase [Bacteroidota bacterium]